MHHFRLALRQLLKSPGFTAIAVLTIAVGIGANTALFSIFNRLVLAPLDLPQPDQVVRLWANNPDRNLLAPVISVPKYEMFVQQQTVFASLSASVFNGHILQRDGADPESLASLNVTQSWIPTLGLPLVRGRNFTLDEDRPGAPRVVIITEALWKSHFGARDGIVGETLMLSGVPHTVVGVLGGPLPAPISFVSFIVPRALEGIGLTPEQIRAGSGFMSATARLKPGVTFAQADAEVRTISQRYKEAFSGNIDLNNNTELRTWVEEQVGNIRPTLYVLLTAVGLVLLIACANVSNLFLSRLTARHKEIAVRLSLGATRGELVRQFLLETALFCAISTGLGVFFAVWSLSATEQLLVNQLAPNTRFTLSGPTLGFTIAISVAACVIIGLVPALQASRVNLSDVLKDSGRGTPGGAKGGRFRSYLVVVEVALSVLLLVGSGLLLATFLKLQSVPPGFNPKGIASTAVNIPTQRYTTGDMQNQFLDQVMERLRANPQVKNVAVGSSMPVGGFGARAVYAVKGQPLPPPDKRPIGYLFIVSEDYFKLFGIPLRAGRAFGPQDKAGAPGAVIVNESFAKRLFPGEDALGKVILRGPQASIEHQIVGIVGDVKANGLNVAAPDILYFPHRQMPRPFTNLAAQIDGDPVALQAILRTAVSGVDRTQAITLFQTMDAGLRNALGFQRIVATLTGVFAAIALVLSAIGLYSVLAYAVTQRTSEIGIRMALGASHEQVLSLILTSGLKLVLIGLGVGLVVAAGTSRLLAQLLYDVKPLDPAIYLGVAVLFALVGALACLLPARRATKVDPLVALRAE